MSELEYPPSSPTPPTAAFTPAQLPASWPGDTLSAAVAGQPVSQATACVASSAESRRIAALELALDEAMIVLRQLRSQLKDQQILEGQLARLEDFSNMQHQAIGELKHQLTQILSLGLGSDRLLQQARVAITELDAQGLTAQPLDSAGPRLTAAPGVVAAWGAAESATTIATLQRALATAHQQIHTLETQIARQAVTQATLQQAHQELEQERDQQGKRLQSLEQQQAEMQEQILKQMRQAQEYEAAIQHWQTRCLEGQQQAKELEPLLQQLAAQLSASQASLDMANLKAIVTDAQTTIAHLQTRLAQVLASLTPAALPPLAAGDGKRGLAPAAIAPKPVKVDLPNFLSRRP